MKKGAQRKEINEYLSTYTRCVDDGVEMTKEDNRVESEEGGRMVIEAEDDG